MASWTLQRLERAVESFSAQLQCAICLCAYDSPVSLPCNHCFCEECIHRALELKAACPICKTPAKKRRLRYDTTVQELLRATEMLCAAPASVSTVVEPQTPIKQEKNTSKKEKQVKSDQTPEIRASPRRAAKRSSQKSPSTQTLMDMWVTGGSNVKIKKEKTTPVTRAAPRRALTQEMNAQTAASPMSPVYSSGDNRADSETAAVYD
ncbi:Hypothetical protein PHPALM_11566 [Phytophthora palmivora]|uniref:RING-type domain-containing protein n=1 Tax=Phytophthora palmivora TaxID=4796 RepID=A0A2P4Y1X0_9STRA|nr:Hypothetical protein PHPALM_11566 [Phytophthora palmivora]